jgi:predicted DNA-binding transcriptional regulator AlpA
MESKLNTPELNYLAKEVSNRVIKGMQRNEHPQRLLTKHQLMKMLDVSQSTIHNYTKRGILKPIKFDNEANRVYYDIKDIDLLIESSKTN